MSDLGAQARAAEYVAATAARARQVSRQADDQNLPPRAAPVSLTALAKAQPLSRNKGPKAWKPLNMDDIAESSDDSSTTKELGQNTPAHSARMVWGQTSSSAHGQASAPSTQAESIKVNIPKAPRAMMTSNVLATITANDSPQRTLPETVVKLPARRIIQNLYASPGPLGNGVPIPCNCRRHILT